MKTMILAFVLFFGLNTFSTAQTTPAKTKKPASTSTATANKTPASAAAVQPTAPGPTKKDGTADMRYKSNKEAAKAAPATTHTKKDGTPDQRYKENKK